MRSFMVAVNHSYSALFPGVFWVCAVMERRGGDRQDDARATEAGCASGGGERRWFSPFGFGRWDHFTEPGDAQ